MLIKINNPVILHISFLLHCVYAAATADHAVQGSIAASCAAADCTAAHAFVCAIYSASAPGTAAFRAAAGLC